MTALLSALLAVLSLLGGVTGTDKPASESVPATSPFASREVDLTAGTATSQASSPNDSTIATALIAGRANYASPSHGPDYLAMRLPRGTRVRICGAGGCARMTVNDYGPKKSTHDIADIALVRFAAICGWTIAEAKRMGECSVEVEIGSIPLPATDTE